MLNSKENLFIKQMVEQLVQSYTDHSGTNFIDVKNLPARDRILDILSQLIELVFPGYTGKKSVSRSNVKFVIGEILCDLRQKLAEQIEMALKFNCRLENCSTDDCSAMAVKITDETISQLPNIREMIKLDVQAAYDGDPAAKSFEEVVLSYPYIHAITVHRIAHELYIRDVPMIPRIMSESAHSATGIDIHPGAKIGRSFFIDHGTGVVIGETTVIGDNVKLYQGVTLGALSFPKDERGRIIKGGKRHPTIEDNVTIYAEATILGNITIGRNVIIPANSWIKKSIPAGSTVASSIPKSRIRTPHK